MYAKRMDPILGYHGTNMSSANAILDTGTFTGSTNGDDWLGSGVYFFTELRWAVRWAKDIKPMRMRQQAERRGRTLSDDDLAPAIVMAPIAPDHIIDLRDPEVQDTLRPWLSDIAAKLAAENQGKRHFRDHAAFDTLVREAAAKRMPIAGFRGSFPEEPLFPGSAVGQGVHEQLVVLNPQLIGAPTLLPI